MDAEVSEKTGAPVSLEKPVSPVTVSEIFKEPLRVPNYQRDYEWDTKLVQQLLEDLYNALNDKDEKQYHLGVIILHNNRDGKRDIVDGQQRLTTLALINRCLKDGKEDPAWEFAAWNKNSRDHFRRNKKFIEVYLQYGSLKKQLQDQDLFSKVKLTVIQVDELSEAFQLYNTQNTRGKDLDAVDILKAYHLKAMEDHRKAMKDRSDDQEAKERETLIIKAWDDHAEAVKNLFDNYLYPVVKWSGRECGIYGLQKKEWELFRGVPVKDQDKYDYVAAVSENRFQILSPFRDGEQFFKYVFHYLAMSLSLKKLMKDSEGLCIYPFLMKKDNTDPERIGLNRYVNLLELTDGLYLVLQLAFVDRFKHSDPADTKNLIEALKSFASGRPEHQRLPDLTKYELEQLFLCSFYYRFACDRVLGFGINAYVLRSPNVTKWSKYPNENPFIALHRSRTPAEFFSRLGKYDLTKLRWDSEGYGLVENPDFSKHLTEVQNG
jgi:hypothetical protein